MDCFAILDLHYPAQPFLGPIGGRIINDHQRPIGVIGCQNGWQIPLEMLQTIPIEDDNSKMQKIRGLGLGLRFHVVGVWVSRPSSFHRRCDQSQYDGARKIC